MKIKLEFATDGKLTYPLGYVIIAENEDDEKVLNRIRNMHFFTDVKYAGMVSSENDNVGKLMFENPNVVTHCISGAYKGIVCKEHAEHIICARHDYPFHLSLKEFKEVVKSQFEISD